MIDYYETNFTLINSFSWNLNDIENMFFWEREIYAKLVENYIEGQKQKETEMNYLSGI